MKQIYTILFATILSLVGAGAVFASGADDCQKAIKNKIYEHSPQTEKVVFHADSLKHEEKSKTEDYYKGEGEFQRHTGKWESFHWECSYDTKKNSVIIANYEVTTREPEAGSSVPALKDLVGARAGQAEGEVKKRGFHWKKSDGAYSYWVEESTKYCVSIRTEDGRYKSIVYATSVDCK